MKHIFFYDESEHSRKINKKTVQADLFYDGFITSIVGWNKTDEAIIESRYLSFEEKHKHRKSNGEIKSQTIKQSQMKFGFASFNKDNIAFLNDYLSVFDEKVVVYFSLSSKLEYIVNQLFKNYNNSLGFDMDALRYSVTKAIVTYKPLGVIESIYNCPQSAVTVMRIFFEDRIQKNRENPALKQLETKAFEQILVVLDDANQPLELSWDYRAPFYGFKRYLKESNINNYQLLLDREGEEQKTLKAAQEVGLTNVSECDSKDCIGIRMADMFAGIIAKMMKSLSVSLTPSKNGKIEKVILNKEWFDLKDEQLELYHKLYSIAIEQNKRWYKTFTSRYSDNMVVFIALLRFMHEFKSAAQLKENLSLRGEQFNSYACQSLADRFSMMRHKLPIIPISQQEIQNGFFFNQRGAKVYYNAIEQPKLPISAHGSKYKVLSVGIANGSIPLVTIEQKGKAICYRIPNELLGWVQNLVECADVGESILPSEVVFTKQLERYCADIL